ncbi:MAG TPA: imidazole glycerol phosphate synthase cyclase subunit, partial [Solirubrobacterales bacterium]
VPFTIGGGVREVRDAQAVLDAGADKVSVNSAALDRPELIAELAEVFGSQCVVIAIDAKRRGAGDSSETCQAPPGFFGDLEWDVYVHGGRSRVEGREAVAWGKDATELGAGEVLLTSMDRDGTTDGYDLELTRAVAEAVSVPVIASGGAGELDHLVEAIEAGHADAVLCASIFHYGQHTVAEAKQTMERAGIPVRSS